MKLKHYLETLPENINSSEKGLYGKELRILEPFLDEIEELKGKKIEIIEEVENIGEPIMEVREDGVYFSQNTNPKMISLKGTEFLGNKVKLYSICLNNDDVIIRCTSDSI